MNEARTCNSTTHKNTRSEKKGSIFYILNFMITLPYGFPFYL